MEYLSIVKIYTNIGTINTIKERYISTNLVLASNFSYTFPCILPWPKAQRILCCITACGVPHDPYFFGPVSNLNCVFCFSAVWLRHDSVANNFKINCSTIATYMFGVNVDPIFISARHHDGVVYNPVITANIIFIGSCIPAF